MDNSTICSHCGKEYDESYSYCPYCAEPKPIPKKENNSDYYWGIASQCISISIGVFVGVFVLFVFNLSLAAVVPALLCAIVSLILVVLYHKNKSENRKNIDKQFYKDQTSICPSCGSHSVSLGRKGYDWNKGFWYRIFDIKGGHYLAGMDSRRVIAHCNSCGHKWETDKEWIR